jgi:hypothetical protein
LKSLLVFVLALFSSMAFCFEVRIRCEKLGGEGSCVPAGPNLSFMRINDNPIIFNKADGCNIQACDWLGSISPQFLIEGSNRAFFQVATVTSDSRLFTHQRFTFIFSGAAKDSLESKRSGDDTDKVTRNIYLVLSEIDPALYNEYQEYLSYYSHEYGKGDFLDRYTKKLGDEKKEIDGKLDRLRADLESIRSKQFDEIDQGTLDRLGIAQGQLSVLSARREELDLFIKQSSQSQEQVRANIQARYEAIRAQARRYDSILPDLPIKPHLETTDENSISPMIQELNEKLTGILVDYSSANQDENLENLRKTIRRWRILSDYAVKLYTEGHDLGSAEKNLLYGTILKGTDLFFKDGLTNDLWKNANQVRPDTRQEIDELAESGVEEAQGLRQRLIFKKIPKSIEADVNQSLERAQQLSTKIKTFSPKNENETKAKEIANASLAVGLSFIDSAIRNEDKEALVESDRSISIGLQVLDVGLNVLPLVSTARDVFELFTGKNLITGEEFGTLEYSMAFVGVFAGMTGFNLAKVAFEGSLALVAKISKKLKSFTEPVISKQVANLLVSYKLLRAPNIKLFEAMNVNKILRQKYPRFKTPPFGGTRVMQRLTEKGEKFCRFFTTFLKNGETQNNKIPSEGGLFVFRCYDVMWKSPSEILEMAAIPKQENVTGFFMAEVVTPPGVNLFDGIANEAFNKDGGAIQIFLDTMEGKLLEIWQECSVQVEIKEVFKGFL